MKHNIDDDSLDHVGSILLRIALLLIGLWLIGAVFAVWQAYSNTACAHEPPGQWYEVDGQRMWIPDDYYNGYVAGFGDGARWGGEYSKEYIDKEIGRLRADQQQFLDQGWLQGYQACKAGQ